MLTFFLPEQGQPQGIAPTEAEKMAAAGLNLPASGAELAQRINLIV